MANRSISRNRRKARVRSAVRLRGNGRPRLSVFRSARNIYAQVIDDRTGRTVAAASTLDENVKVEKGSDKAAATVVGTLIAERASAAGVREVVFDRGAYLFHGRVKALADAAREHGLRF